jgi:hypothetical protein
VKHRLTMGLAVFLLNAPAASAAPFLVGTWFGEGQPYDKHEMWVARMLPNGNFRAEFRACIKGKAHDQIQTGQWSLAGDMETITTVTVNGSPDRFASLYKILWQNGKKQTYRYMPTGFVYTSTRVADTFELPSCEAIS